MYATLAKVAAVLATVGLLLTSSVADAEDPAGSSDAPLQRPEAEELAAGRSAADAILGAQSDARNLPELVQLRESIMSLRGELGLGRGWSDGVTAGQIEQPSIEQLRSRRDEIRQKLEQAQETAQASEAIGRLLEPALIRAAAIETALSEAISASEAERDQKFTLLMRSLRARRNAVSGQTDENDPVGMNPDVRRHSEQPPTIRFGGTEAQAN